MHIYTMGTRNYAKAVANVIDPNKDLFKERILSRDESGSKVPGSVVALAISAIIQHLSKCQA